MFQKEFYSLIESKGHFQSWLSGPDHLSFPVWFALVGSVVRCFRPKVFGSVCRPEIRSIFSAGPRWSGPYISKNRFSGSEIIDRLIKSSACLTKRRTRKRIYGPNLRTTVCGPQIVSRKLTDRIGIVHRSCDSDCSSTNPNMVNSTQSNPHCIFYFQRQVLFFFNGINFLRFFEVFEFFNTRKWNK